MSKTKATHQDSTDFDGPIDAGDAHAKRPADKRKVGQVSDDGAYIKKDVEVMPSGKVAEEVTKLFDGIEGLTEGFAEKTGTLVEGILSEQIENLREQFEEEYSTRLAEEVEAVTEDLENHLDSYLNLVVEKWLAENELAVVTGIKRDIAEQVIESMVAIVEGAGVELPEDKVDMVEALQVENEELENRLNEALNENIELSQQTDKLMRMGLFSELTEDMTEASKDKLSKLVENISYSNFDEYVEKVKILKESIDSKSNHNPSNLNEEFEVVDDGIDENIDSRMREYILAARGSARN